jgi:uncharacterized protein YodC (DUF2158 family)
MAEKIASYQIGNVVRIKPGPPMTVELGDGKFTNVLWFEGSSLRKGRFRTEDLEPAEAPPRDPQS